MSKAKKATMPDALSVATDDTPDIAPALSEQEWHAWRTHRLNPVTMLCEVGMFAPNADNLVKTIAIAFDQIHDEDARKIVRPETITMLRLSAKSLEWLGTADLATTPDEDAIQKRAELFSQLHELADALQSYLSPEAL